MKHIISIRKTAWLIAGAAMLSAAPSLAQDVSAGPDEDIVVTSRYGSADNVQSLSQAVSYRDLDLSTEAGRKILRHRISLTARFLCNKLGESESSTGVAPSCRQSATADAAKRVGTIEEGFAPRGSAWVAPPAWAPPYPQDWDSRYPG